MKKKHFKPGTFGCHEALHMASFLTDAVEQELLRHPAIRQNKEWKAWAKCAVDALGGLYMAIGDEHL